MMTKRTPWVSVLLGIVIGLIVASAVNAWVVGKDWWQPVNAAGTLIVGIGLLYVAHRQYITNGEKLRFELFEKRFHVYSTIMDILDQQFTTGKFAHEAIAEFQRRIRESRFLFPGDEIEKRLTEMRSKVLEAQAHTRRIDNPNEAQDLSEAQMKLSELGLWFTEQTQTLHEAFAPFMKMRF